VEVGKAVLAMRHRLAVDQHVRREPAQGRGDRREIRGPVPAVAGPQANPIAVLPREQTDAVVLQLVDPLWPRGDLRGGSEQRGRDKALGTATVPGRP